MSYQDDHRLLDDLKKRKSEAFAWVFEHYADKIYRLGLSILENEADADGVVQDTFVKLFEHLDRFEGRSKIGTWLYRVAYNICQDHLRQQQKNQKWLTPANNHLNYVDHDFTPINLVDWTHSPETLFEEIELDNLLQQLIQSLPAKLRIVFMLRDVEGLSINECAHSLDLSESACKVRLHRARLQLREKLSNILDERLEGESNQNE